MMRTLVLSTVVLGAWTAAALAEPAVTMPAPTSIVPTKIAPSQQAGRVELSDAQMDKLKAEVGEDVLQPAKRSSTIGEETGRKWFWFW